MKRFVAKPISIKPIFFLHNAFLSIASLVVLVLFLEILIPNIYNHGLLWAICDQASYSHRIEYLYYINYLIKYYEFIDTIFLVLKKKKLEFLHVYHHSMTMALCFFELEGKTSVSWVPVVLNLFVHVIMYYYYARTAVSSKPVWWKKYLTTLQIVQFVIDLAAIYLATYIYLSSTHLAHILPNFNLGTCSGTPLAAGIGCAILSSYLLLFVQFFIKTYNRVGKKGSKGGKAATAGVSAAKQALLDAAEIDELVPAVQGERSARKRATRRAD
ncbi:fatty acid elongase [Fimicolochytrium jonesii]|uniref:fatty acid elongase n=1 Tax=Fimicolochytrium jonesii TaxID=1396493 RepID=UPI0022FDE5A4|nr:fatty acid elongase [Fimicolochytrium jonesii]KAI8817655.1 fatty acid elongase [Fimicolochytrium jonesii]